jgi:hypothetical protein
VRTVMQEAYNKDCCYGLCKIITIISQERYGGRLGGKPIKSSYNLQERGQGRKGRNLIVQAGTALSWLFTKLDHLFTKKNSTCQQCN